MKNNNDVVPRSNRKRRFAAATAGALALFVVLTACSGTSAPGAEQSKSAADLSPEAQAASLAIADMGKPAETIGVQTKLDEKPAPGKTVIMLQCERPTCADFTKGVQAAADRAGWTLKVLTFNTAEPSTLVSAMEQALQFKPVAVSFSGVPISVWGSVVPKFEAAGVAIIPISVGDVDISKGVPVNLSDDDNFDAEGTMAANWVIASSDAKANALVVDAPAYEVVHARSEGFLNTLKSKCSGCKGESLAISLTQLSTNAAVPAVISAVRRNPAIDYVFASESEMTSGLRLALDSAGLEKVRIVGGAATNQDFESLKQGNDDAYSFQSQGYIGWQVVDSALRFSQGMTIPKADGGWPLILLSQDNIAKFAANKLDPKDYQDQFAALWNVG